MKIYLLAMVLTVASLLTLPASAAPSTAQIAAVKLQAAQQVGTALKSLADNPTFQQRAMKLYGDKLTATTGTGGYLDIDAGVTNTAGTISANGKVLAIGLNALEYTTLTMVFEYLGATNLTLSESCAFTIPGYRLDVLGLIMKGKPIPIDLALMEQLTPAKGQ
jgi:hypothetical protein